MESQAPQLIRAARKKAKDKIWHVLSTIVIFGTCLALTIVYWPVAEEESAILMLSTLKSTNVPWVISLNGAYDNNLNFGYGEKMEVKRSCAATLKGEMYVFSGPTLNGHEPVDSFKQISKVGGCKLTRVGDLPYDYEQYSGGGGCNTFLFEDVFLKEVDVERVMLCFYDGPGKKCISWDGQRFDEDFEETTFEHVHVNALTSYRGKPFITGSDASDGRQTEYLDLKTGKWIQGTDYPFGEGDNAVKPRIRNYATAYTENSVYIIGGRQNDYGYYPKNRQMTAIIAQYNNDKWIEVGRLEKPRENHAAITVDGITTVLGGAYLDDQGTTFTEQWNMTLFEINWEKVAPHISDEMSDEMLQQLEPLKIDPDEEHPILSTDYRDGIALFAVKQTTREGYCVKGG